jgi:hypothetical protein
MNATNRVVNRVALALVALVLGVGGAALLLHVVDPAWAQPLRAQLDDAVAAVGRLFGDAAVIAPDGRRIPAAALAAAGAGVLIVVLAVIFVSTRGGGRSATALSVRDPRGATSADANIVSAIVDAELERRADVIAVHTDVHVVRGETVVRIRVRPRRGADLVGVLAAAGTATEEWAALCGRRMPVLLHLSEHRLVDRLRSTTRVR